MVTSSRLGINYYLTQTDWDFMKKNKNEFTNLEYKLEKEQYEKTHYECEAKKRNYQKFSK